MPSCLTTESPKTGHLPKPKSKQNKALQLVQQTLYWMVVTALSASAFSIWGNKDDTAKIEREATPVHYIRDRRYFNPNQGLANTEVHKNLQDKDSATSLSL